MIAVIAKDNVTASEFMMHHALRPNIDAYYISSPEVLYGCSCGFTYILAKGYGDRVDWPAIYNLIMTRQGRDVTSQFSTL